VTEARASAATGCALLAEALDCTEALRLAVESGRWEEASALEERRRGLLERFFARVTPPEELAEAVDRLRRLAAANDALIGIADHVQRALEREAVTISTGRRAARAYLHLPG
jgi:Flagellar protein FliT